MSRPRKDLKLTGKRYGRLVVVEGLDERDAHRNRLWVCRCDCGAEKKVSQCHLRRGATKSCGCLQKQMARKAMSKIAGRKGAASPAWRGGRSVNACGYVHVWVPDYPGDTKPRVELEHRYVMAKKMGRPLKRRETVHHKNGDRADNRESNLELRLGDHGPGQAVTDKVQYAVEILKEYRPDLLRL